MDVFRTAPYSLTFDTLIVGIGYATNNLGTSTASPANTIGAKVRTEPEQMN